MNEKDTQNQTVWRKLMAIQKAVKPFGISEESDKKNSDGSSAYRYTPGWEIIETIRKEMDERGLMLVQDVNTHDVRLIDYPVYKMINGVPTVFNKKEMFVTVNADFTWVDTENGQSVGPFRMSASGANGTDKSSASALALAERYFLLKFFHITTHEKTDEPDAHDNEHIPGIPAGMQPAAMPQNYNTQCVPAAAQNAAQQRPRQGAVRQGGPGNYQGIAPAAPAPSASFNPTAPAIAEAVERLSNFDKGTNSHQIALNGIIGSLSAAGYRVFDGTFIGNLTEAAQARRENRAPAFS